MDRLDEQQALVFESEFACAVLGNRETGQFLLVDLGSNEPLPEVHNMYFCGVAGYRRGECVAKCEADLDCITMMCAASYEFARRTVAWLKAKDTDWLSRLYELPDTREN